MTCSDEHVSVRCDNCRCRLQMGKTFDATLVSTNYRLLVVRTIEQQVWRDDYKYTQSNRIVTNILVSFVFFNWEYSVILAIRKMYCSLLGVAREDKWGRFVFFPDGRSSSNETARRTSVHSTLCHLQSTIRRCCPWWGYGRNTVRDQLLQNRNWW